jgi:hypothetical protein
VCVLPPACERLGGLEYVKEFIASRAPLKGFHSSRGDDAMCAWWMSELYLLTVKPERMQAPVRRFE